MTVEKPHVEAPAELVEVGRVTRPHGVRGEVRVELYNEASSVLADNAGITIRDARGRARRYPIQSARPVKAAWLVVFSGVETREAADALRGATLWVPKDALPELGEDEFYWHEIEGAEAVDETGGVLGVVERVTYTSVDVLELRLKDGREVMVPAVEDFVVAIDRAARRVVVRDIDLLF